MASGLLRPRGGEDSLQRAFQTVQFYGGYSVLGLRCRITASVRRPAHQFGAVVDAATEARDQDTSGFVETGLPSPDLAGFMK